MFEANLRAIKANVTNKPLTFKQTQETGNLCTITLETNRENYLVNINFIRFIIDESRRLITNMIG